MYKFSSPSTCIQAGGGKKYASRKDGGPGGGNKPRWAVDGIWPAMAMAAPPPTMATRLPLLAAKIAFYVIRSFIHHACFTSVIQTHRKLTFTPVRVT